MPVEFQTADLWTLAGLLLACAIATLLPALIAYRQSPAQALRA
jgi:putative ABC transport system permease protein